MKRMIFKIITLIAIAFLCLTAYSQSSENKKKTREEQEVKKFADSFLDSFIEKKDLGKIPARFFEKDFKKRFMDNEECFSQLFKDGKTSTEDRYKMKITYYNFFNLLAAIARVRNSRKRYSDSDDKEAPPRYLPASILKKFKKTKWLRVFSNDSETEAASEPETPDEFNDFAKEISAASDYMSAYLQKHPVKKSSNFLKLRRETSEYYPAEICQGDSCIGLPEGTPIFAVHELMMYLQIAKINNRWKIVQIYSMACED